MFNLSLWIDDGRNSGIGTADDIAVVFEGTQADVEQVLARAGGVAEPGVVGEIDEEIGSGFKKVGRKSRKDPFKTDRRGNLEPF